MVRRERESGKDSFELIPEKANTLHDDRAYTAALAGYALMCERRKSIINKPRKSNVADLVSRFPIRQGTRFTTL
jgi:hypothetical protein